MDYRLRAARRERSIGIHMFWTGMFAGSMLGLLVGAAFAGGHGPAPVEIEEFSYHEDPKDGDAWFGRIVIFSQEGSTGGTRQFDTLHGRGYISHLPGKSAPTVSQWGTCRRVLPLYQVWSSRARTQSRSSTSTNTSDFDSTFTQKRRITL